jgi:hypothetical protein
MNDFHEKIANALNALADVVADGAGHVAAKKKPNPVYPQVFWQADPVAKGVAAASNAMKSRPTSEKKAEDESFGSAYRRATGEDLPDEVAENPAARAAVEKLAAASLRVNDLGSPSERSDPSARREAPQGTRAERYKQAFDNFGEDLINSRR